MFEIELTLKSISYIKKAIFVRTISGIAGAGGGDHLPSSELLACWLSSYNNKRIIPGRLNFAWAFLVLNRVFSTKKSHLIYL